MKKIIDISDWQDGISFDAIKSAGFDGVIYKLAEGCSPSACWKQYANAAKAAGLPYGVYIYARALDAEGAKLEAMNALQLCKDAGLTTTLGIWYDIEAPEIVGENGGSGIGNAQITANASAFISKCNANGVYAGIYAPWWVIRDRIDTAAIADYVPYWVSYAAFNGGNPLAGSALKCAGWQYAIDGTNGETVGGYGVDVSEWYI